MSMTRILIVDNEATSRNLLRKMLSGYANLDIAGSVSTCGIALSKIPLVNPDIVIMDVEMPDSDVIQTLHQIRKIRPELPVVMLCTRNQNKHAARVLEALAAGANDYCVKSAVSLTEPATVEQYRSQLFKKLKPFIHSPLTLKNKNHVNDGKVNSPVSSGNNLSEAHPSIHQRQASSKRGETDRIDLLAIGVSTGGPQALDKILPKLPADFPVPIVIVQHMPDGFTNILAKRLNTRSAIVVSEGENGGILRPGKAWLAQGGSHMVVRPGEKGVQIKTHRGPPENSCRPAVDVLFRSVADCYGKHVLAVVLTGMGQDGLRGCEAISESGGTIFIQDEKSSVVWGMPGALAKAGLANKVLSIDIMAAEIVKRVGRLQVSSTTQQRNQRLIAT